MSWIRRAASRRRPRGWRTAAWISTHHQHWKHRDVPELTSHTAPQNVRQAAMPVRRHRDQVALLAYPAGRDLTRRVAARQNRLSLKTVALERVGDRFDVLAVALHLLRFAQVELIDVARRPAVGDVDQHYRRTVARPRQLPDVRENHFVVRRVLDRHEYALIHQPTDLPKNWRSSQMLSAAMITATA